MRIQVNGQDREVPQGITIAELLDKLQMNVAHVAVEVNLNVVPRAQHAPMSCTSPTAWKWSAWWEEVR